MLLGCLKCLSCCVSVQIVKCGLKLLKCLKMSVNFRIIFDVQVSPEPAAVYVFASLQWILSFCSVSSAVCVKNIASTGPIMRNLTHLLTVAWEIFLYCIILYQILTSFAMQVPAPRMGAYHSFFPCCLSSCPRCFYLHVSPIPFAACHLMYLFQPLAFPPFCSVIASQFEFLCPVSPKFSWISLHAPQCLFLVYGVTWSLTHGPSALDSGSFFPVLNRTWASFSLLVYGSNSCVYIYLT